MRKGAGFLLCFCLALSSAVWVSGEAESESVVGEAFTSDVLTLDVSNFTEAVEKYDFLVVEFYAPWCGHCKKLAPEYEKAATTLKSQDPPIILAKVDLDEEKNKPLASEYDIKGFPTLKVIRKKGEVVEDYKGPRESAGIVSYLEKLSGPASAEVTSAEQVKEFLTEHENDVTIVGVFDSFEGEEYKNFLVVADVLRSSYFFIHTTDASFIPDNGVPIKAPSVRLYKNFDDRVADFNEFTLEVLANWIDTQSLPWVTEMTKKPEHRPALMKFFESPKEKVYLFTARPEDVSEEETAAIVASFTKDAKVYNQKGLIFLFAGSDDSDNALQLFGLLTSDLPAYVIQNDQFKKFVSKSVKAEQLAPWLDEFLGGNLKEHIKSDAIPLTNDEPVKVVVADSLKDTVLDSDKDVLLEFYAPWCGHCKKLAPVLDEVAIAFESDPKIMIAKFDATTNDVSSDLFEVKGYPTLYLYSPGGVVTPFDGDRTKEDIIEFINENRSKPVTAEETPEDTLAGGLKESIKETLGLKKDEL